MSWVARNIEFTGRKVTLKPLQMEHISGLMQAGMDDRIWEYLSVETTETAIRAYFMEALTNHKAGTQVVFTIFDKRDNIIGTTRFADIRPEHKGLEIGWTWYKPELWGTGYNEDCKYLLLEYCFEQLGAIRVQLKANERNMRSRRAIQRIGCKFEGVLRHHMIRNGEVRNTAMFSMLPDEWPEAKQRLAEIMEQKYAGTYVQPAKAEQL